MITEEMGRLRSQTGDSKTTHQLEEQEAITAPRMTEQMDEAVNKIPRASYQVEDKRWRSEVPVRDGDTAGHGLKP